jgi:hypothetical protein
VSGDPARSGADTPGSAPRIRDADAPLLRALADVIVPRFGDSPAASEIGLLARFETLLAVSPFHATFYGRHLPDFVERVRARIPMPSGRPDRELLERLCERWYADVRRDAQPSAAARVFDAFRVDVLRLYYASPEGWRFAGFNGPVHWTAERLVGRT